MKLLNRNVKRICKKTPLKIGDSMSVSTWYFLTKSINRGRNTSVDRKLSLSRIPASKMLVLLSVIYSATRPLCQKQLYYHLRCKHPIICNTVINSFLKAYNCIKQKKWGYLRMLFEGRRVCSYIRLLQQRERERVSRMLKRLTLQQA